MGRKVIKEPTKEQLEKIAEQIAITKNTIGKALEDLETNADIVFKKAVVDVINKGNTYSISIEYSIPIRKITVIHS